tara:strand:- start:204 stop:1460 length:1257 start_codon:yes stop_codon:yes gene_type:complete
VGIEDHIQQEKEQTKISLGAQEKKVSKKPTKSVKNSRPEAITQRKLQDMANNKPQGKQTAQLQSIQKQKNKTGLPNHLKTGIENLSGISIDNYRPEFVMESKLASLATNNSTDNTIQREENEAALEEAQGGVPENQQLFVSVIKSINVEGIKGYPEKKDKLESESRLKMINEGVSDGDIDQLLTMPLIQHKIEMIAKGGSKVKKLAEGIEVQLLNGKKYDAFLQQIGNVTGGEVHAAPLKNYARMKTKEEDKYGGDIGRIKDVIRASFIFHAVEGIKAAQELIANMSSHTVIEIKDRFEVTEEELSENLNYKDVIFIIETANITGYPVKIELQLHLHGLHEAKTKIKAPFSNQEHHKHVLSIAPTLGLDPAKIKDNQYTGHDFYKVIRELTKSEIPLEKDIVNEAKNQSRSIYGSALA